MRILVIAPDMPVPAVGGGQIRTYHLLQALAGEYEITLVAFTTEEEAHLPPFPIRVIGVPWDWPDLYKEMRNGDAASSQAAYNLLSSETEEPYFVSCYASPLMEQALCDVTRERFDVIMLEHTMTGRFLPVLPRDTPKVLDLPDVHSVMAERAAQGAPIEKKAAGENEAARTLRFERRVASACDLCITVSDKEAAAAKMLFGLDTVRVVPNGVDTSYFTPTNEPPDPGYLLFTGLMNYEPNVEAVLYFAREVLPLIWKTMPHAHIHIAGAKPVAAVERLASERIFVHGSVPDMRPYFHRAEVVVVPLLQGGGTRLKILEAAASGKAVVTTSLGIEGLSFTHGFDSMIVDPAADFARAVVSLCRDARQRDNLGRNARHAALEYDWKDVGNKFCDLVNSISYT